MKKIFSIIAAMLLITAAMQASAQVAGYSRSNAISAGSYSGSGSYSNTANSATGGFTNNYGNAANDVWYTFTISSSASNTVLISLCGSSFDTYLHVLNSSGTELYNNDDNGPACSGVQSSLSLSNLAPGTYYVDAEGYGSNSGTIDFSLSISIVSPPVISYPSGTHTYANGTTISPLSPTNTGGALAAVNQTLTFAGTGYAGQTDGSGTSASFNQPLGMAMDASGNLYVADAGSHVIRKVTSAGVVTTLAGGGYAGFANGTGTSALFNHPVGLAVDGSGNIYVADENNNAIRKITPAGAVTTLAGNGTAGFGNGTGAGATFNLPCGVALDASGNVYVADYSNNVIRKITSAGTVTTFAGTGTASSVDGPASTATFNHPFSTGLDKSGNVYVADRVGAKIRKITPSGTVSTLAGSTAGYADGTGTSAQLTPTSLTLDTAGNIYVADETNQRIRKVTPTGVTTTIAGTGSTGNTNGVGTAASFNNPFGIVAAPAGYIYVGDQYNYLVRKIVTAPYTINPGLPTGLSLDPSAGTISGTPATGTATTAYTVTAYSLTGQSVQAPALSIAVTSGSLLNLSNLNYIAAYSPRISGMSTTAQVYINSGDKTKVAAGVQYFDGLGRPMQTVQVRASPLGNDIVQLVTYDQYGRETTKYLSYVTPGTNNGAYRSAAIGEQSVFYHPTGSTSGSQQGNGIINTASPYAQTNFEPSPLNRVIEQGAPGDAWQPGSGTAGHTVKIAYGTNAAEVIMWSVNSNGNGATGTTAYTPGTLYKTITTDENGNNTYEYKDKQGFVVCKMVQNGNAYLATYYVYDDNNNLAYVIPPIPATTTYPTSFLETDPVFINFIYGYHYDSRNRLIQKKIPGKGWEFTVYNTLDQVVMTQDANQRNKSPQQWIFIKYDAQGRQIISGIYIYAGSSADNSIASPGTTEITTLQNFYNTTTHPKWEAPASGTTSGYDGLSDPQGQSFAYLKINYYDDYTFAGNPYSYIVNNQIPGMPATNSTMTRGLITATKTAVLNTITNTPPDMLWTVTYYDDLGRAIQEDKQHYLGGTTNLNTANHDQISNGYNFTNAITNSIRKHYTATGGATPAVTIANSYVYDHEGRNIQTLEAIASGSAALPTPIVLSQSDYNEIGQLSDKKLHSTNSGGSFLQETDYAYNERGWLKTSSAPLFAMQLNYNDGTTPQYNGNISNQLWGTPGSLTKNYVYRYDNLNRLVSGIASTGNTEKSIAYDNLGNITGLQRYLTNTEADALKYNYVDVNGNATTQLQSITDSTTNDAGMKHGTFTYAYDGNGNMTADNSKGLAPTYNLLDLPSSITITGTSAGTVTYVYDANGTKLRRVSTQGTGSSTDYIDGIEYDATSTNTPAITFVQTEEGRAINLVGSWNYEYNLADHLGDSRLSFDTGTGVARTEQQDDYMPFGMDISVGTIGSPQNYYLYNKKEFQAALGLYDYGARFYDPVIGRWTTVDPKAEKSRKHSPYVYGNDNSIRNIDPDGMITIDGADKNVNGGQATYTTAKDGTVTWINATEDTKKIGNDMLKTDVGKKQLDGMISSTKQVKLVDDKTSLVKDGNGVNKLGYTQPDGKNHETVTIYEKAISLATTAPDDSHHMTETINGEKLNASNYTQDQHIGAVGTHEATHVLDANSNRQGSPNATPAQMEIEPNNNELEYYHEIDKQ